MCLGCMCLLKGGERAEPHGSSFFFLQLLLELLGQHIP